METEGARLAREWLAERDVVPAGDGWWHDGQECSANEVAHDWTDKALEDPGLDDVGRVRVALGLLDLLDQYAVTMYLKTTPLSPEADALFWEAYRRRLEAPASAEPVTYSLWVDWFEDPLTAEGAFAEVVARPDDLADGPLRRNRRVLAVSGPVPWRAKRAVYEAAATVPELHLALFHGLLGSRYDVYGDLDAPQALALLRRLDLPEGTANVDVLREELEARR
ncbi:hypothetical protein [Umezawaea sp.]|uniref:hypothetical protein n=1 Tax=Umezawaea sp. TaxID=1955258 RepID=UPI002ED2C1A7